MNALRSTILIVSVVTAFCLFGCSKEGGTSTKKSKRLVPKSAAAVMASPDYKLEHTTASGIKCYVRPLTAEIAKSVPEESDDQEFLQGDDKTFFYFLVPIRNGKILAGENVEMTAAESFELMGFVMKKDPEMQKMLKEAGKK